MKEEWRVIAEFPDYSVSSEGLVKRIVPDRYGRISGMPLKPVVGNHGYFVVSLHRDAKQSVRLIHRLVCAAFHGKSPSKWHEAAHYDGNKLNNSATNLRWAVHIENDCDKQRHGTRPMGDKHRARIDPSYLPRGSAHVRAKLNEQVVMDIRSDQRPQPVIAAQHGISQSLVSQVKNRKIWRHVI